MSTIALQILGGTIDPSVYVVIIIALVLLWYFVLRGIFRIADDQIGILIRKFTGEKMPQAKS